MDSRPAFRRTSTSNAFLKLQQAGGGNAPPPDLMMSIAGIADVSLAPAATATGKHAATAEADDGGLGRFKALFMRTSDSDGFVTVEQLTSLIIVVGRERYPALKEKGGHPAALTTDGPPAVDGALPAPSAAALAATHAVLTTSDEQVDLDNSILVFEAIMEQLAARDGGQAAGGMSSGGAAMVGGSAPGDGEAGDVEVDQTTFTEVRRVGFVRYLKAKLASCTGQKEDDDVEYVLSVNWAKLFEITPRKKLMWASTIISVLVFSATVLTFALLWTARVSADERDQLGRGHRLILTGIEGFQNAVLSRTQETMAQNSKGYSLILGRLLANFEDDAVNATVRWSASALHAVGAMYEAHIRRQATVAVRRIYTLSQVVARTRTDAVASACRTTLRRQEIGNVSRNVSVSVSVIQQLVATRQRAASAAVGCSDPASGCSFPDRIDELTLNSSLVCGPRDEVDTLATRGGLLTSTATEWGSATLQRSMALVSSSLKTTPVTVSILRGLLGAPPFAVKLFSHRSPLPADCAESNGDTNPGAGGTPPLTRASASVALVDGTGWVAPNGTVVSSCLSTDPIAGVWAFTQQWLGWLEAWANTARLQRAPFLSDAVGDRLSRGFVIGAAYVAAAGGPTWLVVPPWLLANDVDCKAPASPIAAIACINVINPLISTAAADQSRARLIRYSVARTMSNLTGADATTLERKLLAEVPQSQRQGLVFLNAATMTKSAALVVALPVSVAYPDVVLVLALGREPFVYDARRRGAAMMDHLNFGFTWTTEFVVGWRNEITGVVVPQQNRYRFQDDCVGGPTSCERVRPFSSAAWIAIEQGASGSQIQADYRPQPCVAAYAFIKEYEVSFVIERDVVDVNGASRQFVTSILSAYASTASLPDSVPLLVGSPMSPASQTYDSAQPCPSTTLCDSRGEEFGVVFRGDCMHCATAPSSDSKPSSESTSLEITLFAGARLSNTAAQRLAAQHLSALTKSRTMFVGPRVEDPAFARRAVLLTDEQNRNMIIGLAVNLSVSVAVVGQPVQLTDMASNAIVAAAVVTLVAAVVLHLLIGHLLASVQHEWMRVRRAIQTERDAFYRTTVDVIPNRQYFSLIVNHEASAGSKIGGFHRGAAASHYVAETISATVAVLDFSASAERFEWDTAAVARFAWYCVALVDAVSDHFGVFRIRTIGDRHIVLGAWDREDATVRHAVKVLAAVVTVQQLCRPTFAHFPARLAHISAEFGASAAQQMPGIIGLREYVGCIAMPAVRAAVHCSDVAAIMMPLHLSSPKVCFDVAGNAISVACRLASVTKGGGVLATPAVKKSIRVNNATKMFRFERHEASIVRGRAVVVASYLAHSRAPVASAILSQLGVKYARRAHIGPFHAFVRLATPPSSMGSSKSTNASRTEADLTDASSKTDDSSSAK